jgi:hypothetical protein
MPYPSQRNDDSCPGTRPEHRASTVPLCKLSTQPKDINLLPAEPSLTKSVFGAARDVSSATHAGGRRPMILWQETSIIRPLHRDLSQLGRVNRQFSTVLIIAARVSGGSRAVCNVMNQAFLSSMVSACTEIDCLLGTQEVGMPIINLPFVSSSYWRKPCVVRM